MNKFPTKNKLYVECISVEHITVYSEKCVVERTVGDQGGDGFLF